MKTRDTIIQIERQIAQQCVADLLSAGFAVSVNDGNEITVSRSRDMAIILAAMFSSDEDYLLAHEPDGADFSRNHFAWVRFIYGNDGWDVINDYSTNLESTLSKTLALSERLENE